MITVSHILSTILSPHLISITNLGEHRGIISKGLIPINRSISIPMNVSSYIYALKYFNVYNYLPNQIYQTIPAP